LAPAGEDQAMGQSLSGAAASLGAQIWSALGSDQTLLEKVEVSGDASLKSYFPVSDLAVASIGAAGLALSELICTETGYLPAVRVDRSLASRWFVGSIIPEGWQLPAAWDTLAGDYETADGWVRLHTNAPQHRAAALRALGIDPERPLRAGRAARVSVAESVASWASDDLEAAVVAAGGAAAIMRSLTAWTHHPQGRAVALEPLVALEMVTPVDDHLPRNIAGRWSPDPARPLRGLRVLDLTRVLAGPVATRLLAGFGAEVLRIDPPDWDEPGTVPEVAVGKRCARLDARTLEGRAQLHALLASADVLVHGYRPGALDRLGLGAEERHRVRPGLIEASLDAYGWTGPGGSGVASTAWCR
jgi:crotonobetainyl-CoA:carnitine CoA-transferase CaiB-like acyl-CoA transferase